MLSFQNQGDNCIQERRKYFEIFFQNLMKDTTNH